MTTHTHVPAPPVTLTERMNTLLRQRIPFVRVTVVRAQKPTSVRAGNEAIVLRDGTIEGFIGGVCAEDSVRQAAMDALSDGETLLLRVLPDETEPFPAADGARVVQNPCLSGGAMEMFLQPLLPPPLIQIAGDSAISAALAVMAPNVGFAVAQGDDDADGALAVIVSSMGRDEIPVIRAALAAGVPLIGLVASPKRGAAVLDQLRLPAEDRARVRTPIGLWIGAKTAEEIALSILAELIKAVRLEGLGPAPAGSGPSAAATSEVQANSSSASGSSANGSDAPAVVTVLDPVCGMTVTIGPDAPHLRAEESPDGQEHWFCGPGCRTHFAGRA
jgi:xanthine dehydrogenase accessory factor